MRYRKSLRGTLQLAAILVVTTVALNAQTAHKPAVLVVPNTTAPTKVTGDGVKTDSGLRSWDIKLGLGPFAKAGDQVKVHYTGWGWPGQEVRQLGRRAPTL